MLKLLTDKATGLVQTLQHVTIGIVGDSKEMGRHFIPALSLVLVNYAWTVRNKNT